MAVPGAGYGGYIPLKEIIKNQEYSAGRITFEFKKPRLLADGKPIQGLRIKDDNAIITSEHYTSWEMATQIRSMGRLEPSLSDPFIYLSEPGKMAGWSEKAIKKELGASSANTLIKLSLIISLDRVWIKSSRQVTHFAISGLLTEHQIIKLKIQRKES